MDVRVPLFALALAILTGFVYGTAIWLTEGYFVAPFIVGCVAMTGILVFFAVVGWLVYKLLPVEKNETGPF